ncbi:MAG: hypothetical protein WA160_16120 [Pseudobdellovibrio sp.]
MLLFKLLLVSAFAQIPRIESKYLNISESSKIFIKPGLISVLELPQNIIEVRIGNPNDLKAVISQVSPKEITLYFKNSNVSATNLIIRSERKVFVFDIIPSNSKHQDYIKVSGGYGIVNRSSAFHVLESSAITPKKAFPSQNNKLPKLIERVSL